MRSQTGFTGIAFPFRFSGAGGVNKSTTNANDFSHIKEEVIQILRTNLGERVFKPYFGSELSKSVYDNTDITSVALIESYVRDSLSIISDRIEVLNVNIRDGDTEGSIIISIDIYVKKYMKSDNVEMPYDLGIGGNK